MGVTGSPIPPTLALPHKGGREQIIPPKSSGIQLEGGLGNEMKPNDSSELTRTTAPTVHRPPQAAPVFPGHRGYGGPD